VVRVPFESTIKVLLTQEGTQIDLGANEQAVVVTPIVDGWNDFNLRYRLLLRVMTGSRATRELPMRLLFAGHPSTNAAVEGLVSKGQSVPFADIDQPFVSVLSDVTGYKDLVAELGFPEAFATLRLLHDATAAQLEPVDGDISLLTEGTFFSQGILREDSTWAAYRDGGRFLSPVPPADVEDSARSFTVEAELHGLPGPHRLDVDFGDDFPLSRRCMVLVGENGVGKTRLFRAIIEGLQQHPEWEENLGEPAATFPSPPLFSRLLVFATAMSDQYPSTVSPWHGLDYRFHRLADPSTGADDNLAVALLDCLRLNNLELSRTAFLDDALHKLGIRQSLHVEVTLDEGEDNRLPNPTVIDGRAYLPFLEPHGEQRRLQLQGRMVPTASPKILTPSGSVRNLSSGEKVILRFVAAASASIRRGSLLLIDEPETHLHPRYISDFMIILNSLLDATGSIAVIATHSAFVVREVPSRRVRVARVDSVGELTIDRPRLQTFGASIDTICQFVFDDLTPDHRFERALESWLDDNVSASVGDFRERFRGELNAETLAYVAQAVADRRDR